MSNAASIAELLALIDSHERFLITSHARPDGDAIGSSLGMMHLLEGLGKQAHVAFADTIPVIYRRLPGAARITEALTFPDAAPDAVILLECNNFARTGYPVAAFAELAPALTINIDHHLSGANFASFNWIDVAACAVGAMVYDLAVASGVHITAEMATCLYTAVLTDTGSFTYASTTAGTFALAQHLVECGADANRIAQAVYFSNPASKFHLLGAALSNLNVDGALAWGWVTYDEIQRAGAASEDCEGVVNYLIGIAGVQAAVFLRELPDGGEFRLSIRSKEGLDVARVAESLGGGGHRNASGCTLPGPLPAALDRILSVLRSELC